MEGDKNKNPLLEENDKALSANPLIEENNSIIEAEKKSPNRTEPSNTGSSESGSFSESNTSIPFKEAGNSNDGIGTFQDVAKKISPQQATDFLKQASGILKTQQADMEKTKAQINIAPDPETAALLAETYKKQEADYNTTNKAISDLSLKNRDIAQVPQLEQSFGSELYESFKRGSESLGSMIAKTPAFVNDVAASAVNKVAEYAGLPPQLATSEQIAQQLNLPENEVANWYDAKVKESQEKIAEKYDKGVTEYLFGDNPDYKKGFKLLANQVVESAPISMSLAMGNAAGLTAAQSILGGGAVFGAGNKSELDDQNPDMTENDKIANSVSKGLFEGMFEQFGITKLGSIAKDVFLKGGEKAAADIAKEGFIQTYKPIAKKYFGNQAEEAVSEGATQFAQNAVDKYSGAKPDINLMDGVADAALVGFGSGVAASAPVGTAEIIKKYKSKNFAAKEAVKPTDADLNTELDAHVKAGVMSEQDAQEIVQNVENAKVANEGIPVKKNDTESSRIKKVRLALRRTELEEELKKAQFQSDKDVIKAKIEQIEEDYKTLNNAKPEAQKEGDTTNTTTDEKAKGNQEAEVLTENKGEEISPTSEINNETNANDNKTEAEAGVQHPESETKPDNAGVGEAAKSEHYQEIAGSKPNAGNRIPVDPIIGVKPKKLSEIIFDVTKSLNQKLLYSKPGRKGAGTYSPGSTAVKIKFNGDLDTTAHELAHSIDDLFGLLGNFKNNIDLNLERELMDFAKSPAASKPPKGHPDPRMYELAEGFAEWLRAYIVNPAEAKKLAPNIYDLYESNIPKEYKSTLSIFSDDIRSFAGASGRDMVLSNVKTEVEKSPSILKEIFKRNNPKDMFTINWVDKLAANWVNPLRAFDKAVEHAQGLKGIDELLPKNDPRILSRLLLGIDTKFGSILTNGMIDAENKPLLTKDGKYKNLNWLLEPLDNTDESTINRDMKDVIAYMVAERTVELSKKFGKENILTGIGGGVFKDAHVAKKALEEFENGNPEKLQRIKEAAKRYREFADDILLYMVDKGRLAEMVVDKDGNLIGGYRFIKQNNLQYVALQRIMETEPDREVEPFAATGGSIGGKKETVYKIKGSTKQIENPYVSLIDNVFKSVKESDRNEVMREFRNLIVEKRDMYDGAPKKFAEIGVIGKEGDKNTTTIFVNGKPEHWIFQEDIHNMIKGLDKEGYNLPAVFTALPSLLRFTVTNFPVFAVRNIVRDVQDRMIKSNENNAGNLYGLKSFTKDKKYWQDVARNGGLNAGYYYKDKEAYYSLLDVAMQDLSKGKTTKILDYDRLKNSWQSYTDLLQKGETLNRVAEYKSAYQNAKTKGLDDYSAQLYAASKSRELLDFALMGNWMRYINQMVPFSNAAVQGLYSSIKKAQENPKQFALRMVLISVLPSIAFWFLNHKDDEDAKEYEELPDYQRDMFYNYKIGKNNWVSIPKPYELSLLGAGADRALSKVAGNKEAFKGYAGSVAKSLMVFDESNFAGSYQKIVEGYANYDFFRNKSIIPPYENGLDLELRHTDNASRLGKALQAATGWDARKIDHFIKGTFSYYGNTAIKLSDTGREGKGLDIPDLGFFKNSPAYNSKSVQEYMELAEGSGLKNSRDYKEFGRLLKQYFDAKDDAEKDELGKTLRKYAQDHIPTLEKKSGEKKGNLLKELESEAPEKPEVPEK